MSEYEEHSGDAIKCPYCGHVDIDSWEWDEDDTYECERCHMPSDLRVGTSVTYTTMPSVELLEDEIEDLERRVQRGEVWPGSLALPERIARLNTVIAKLEGAK